MNGGLTNEIQEMKNKFSCFWHWENSRKKDKPNHLVEEVMVEEEVVVEVEDVEKSWMNLQVKMRRNHLTRLRFNAKGRGHFAFECPNEKNKKSKEENLNLAEVEGKYEFSLLMGILDEFDDILPQ